MFNILIKSTRIFFEILSRIIFGLKYWGRTPEPLDPPISDPLLLEPASVLAQKIRTKKVKSEDVVRAFISRIEEVNPTLNAVVDRCFEDAIEDAKKVDNFLYTTHEKEDVLARTKPFLGVPFTSKECLAVEGLRQTMGLYSRKDFVAEQDAEAVRLMKKAGAIMIGVTNIPEVCMWWESFNNVYGRTNNPYDITRVPGGSSGGEGANLSAAGSPMGIGSDIGGSVRIPSFFCGIFAHKPTSEIVSNIGHEPVWVGKQNTFQTVGPMSRFASDLLPMYKVLASSNAHLLSLDEKVDITKLKVFYMEDEGGNCVMTSPVDKELIEAQHKALNYFKGSYGIEPVKLNLPRFSQSISMWFAMFATEKNAMPFELILGNKEKEINVYLELLKCIFRLSKHTFVALLLLLVIKFRRTGDDEKLVESCKALMKELKDILSDDGILLYPSHPTLAPHHFQTLFRFFNSAYTGIFNVLGMPVTQCALGLSKVGLPLGIQVIANPHQDHLCLAAAEELEKAFGGWVSPSKINLK